MKALRKRNSQYLSEYNSLFLFYFFRLNVAEKLNPHKHELNGETTARTMYVSVDCRASTRIETEICYCFYRAIIQPANFDYSTKILKKFN